MPQNLLQQNSADKKVCLNSSIRTFCDMCGIVCKVPLCISKHRSFFLFLELQDYKMQQVAVSNLVVPVVGIRRTSLFQSTCICHNLPSLFPEQKPSSASDFYVIIKTITKLSNVVGYHQPDLSTNRTVYASYLYWTVKQDI